jgi:glycosyltransferase involved in cell wall biosynthesis
MNGSDTRPTVLVVTPFPLAQGGGVGSYVKSMIDALIDDHGWRVVLVTSSGHRRGVQREDHDHLRTYQLPYDIQVAATRFGLSWRRQLKRIIRDESPAIVNVHSPTPGLADVAATVLGDIPLVVTYHAGSMHKGSWPADFFVAIYEKVLCRRLLARADWIIASSDFVRDSFLLRVRAKCSTITPGVDIERFTPAMIPGRNKVLFVAGLRRAEVHKGLDTLLHAMRSLVVGRPDLSLDVVGSGDDLGRYQQLCRSLGIEGQVRAG